jgi:hypothetical protein
MEQDHSETFRQAVDKVTFDVAMMFPADYEISDFVVTLFMGIGGICDHVRTSRTGIATISDKAKDIAQVVRKGCRRQYPELPSEHIDELAAAIVLFAGWLVDHLPKREDDELAMALFGESFLIDSDFFDSHQPYEVLAGFEDVADELALWTMTKMKIEPLPLVAKKINDEIPDNDVLKGLIEKAIQEEDLENLRKYEPVLSNLVLDVGLVQYQPLCKVVRDTIKKLSKPRPTTFNNYGNYSEHVGKQQIEAKEMSLYDPNNPKQYKQWNMK